MRDPEHRWEPFRRFIKWTLILAEKPRYGPIECEKIAPRRIGSTSLDSGSGESVELGASCAQAPESAASPALRAIMTRGLNFFRDT